MIKVISLDIGGTLIKGSEDAKYNLKALTSLVNKDYDLVRNVFKDVFQKTKGTEKELIHSFCEKLEIPETETLREFFKNKYASKNDKVSNHDLEVIKDLKNKGYKIILFSNTSSLQEQDLGDLYNLVDHIYYSYELGYTKSDKESYQIIEKELNCQPEEFLHIGDTLKSDYLKPKSYGWNALYFGESDDKDVISIQDLAEINKYL